MLIEEALATELLGTAAITALVGQRIYPVIADQDTETPYVEYGHAGSHPAPLHPFFREVKA